MLTREQAIALKALEAIKPLDVDHHQWASGPLHVRVSYINDHGERDVLFYEIHPDGHLIER